MKRIIIIIIDIININNIIIICAPVHTFARKYINRLL